jgi:hypothetical protein
VKKLPKTLQGVDARMTKLIIRMSQDANELNRLRIARRAMVIGKRKVAPPPGIKVMFGGKGNMTADEFGDLIPTFGPKPR